MSRLNRDRAWLVWTAVALLVVAGFFAVPGEHWASGIWYDAIGLVSAAMIVVGVRLHRPANPRMWYLFALGQIVWVVGDIIWTVYVYVLVQEPYPSIADAFYLGAYPILFVGLFILARGRATGHDLPGILDAGVVATGLAVLFWTMLIRPITADDSVDLFSRMIAAAYPVADVFMLVIVARLVTSAGIRNASYRMLLAAVLMLLASDSVYTAITTFSTYQTGPVDAGWLLSYVLWGAAALHPTMRELSDSPRAKEGPRFTRRRLALLAGASLLAPAVLLVQGARDPVHIDWIGIGLGAVVLFVLVLVRLAGLLQQVQAQADQLGELALHDELTGLANRRLLHQRIRSALSGQPPARTHLALIDLDGFKAINDQLGHAVGDRLLASVADRLRALPGIDVVARLGGDEFALLLPVSAADTADALVERVLAEIQRPYRAATHELLVQASIGIADGSGSTDTFELLRRADIALYAAKNAGRNRFRRYHPEMDDRAAEDALLGARLRQALDASEFEVAYQPIVDLGTGRLAAVEALVRWPAGGIGPDRFIPIAERNGLIVELGQTVLWTACRQAVAWLADLGDAAPPRVSVNVSPRQLAEPGFADSVATALAGTGLPPHRLTVEVTETAVFSGGQALDELHAVHRLGVRVALDDFGTGHSSLRLLQTCPVDVLKVDKSFIDRITLDGQHSVIAATLIDLTERLGITGVAEGVENEQQATRLRQLGYRYAQGYHFGRPADADAITARIRGHHPSPVTV